MALIKCTECGHDVSDKAQTCPNCGCPVKKRNVGFGWKKPIVAVVVLLVIAGGAYGVWTLLNGTTKDIRITQELAKAVHQYCELDNFHEGLAGVRDKNGMWGFINSKGEEVVACQYERIGSFCEGLACARKNGKWGYIDTRGEVVIPFTYVAVGSFSEGLACFYSDEPNHPLGFIDKKGNVVIPAKYFGEFESEDMYSAPSFKNGICRVLSEGMTIYADDDKVLYIDTKGNVIEGKQVNDNDTETSLYTEFEENGKYGIRDSLNHVIVAAKYSNVIGEFSEGLAAVYLYGENTICGFVDKNGNDTFTKEDWEKLDQYEQKQLQTEAKRIEEELLREEEARRMAAMKPDWIQGTWVYSSSFGASKVVISGDNIAVYMDGSLVYNGSYVIEDENLVYNRHNGMSDYIILDRNSQRLKADETTYFQKVSSNEGDAPSSSNGNNAYSTDEGRKAYMEVQQLQQEVRALIDKSTPYRNIMKREAYGSYSYQTARMQYMDILDAAIQKQEKALRIARNKLHDQSLIRELSGQLETLNKAKYLD